MLAQLPRALIAAVFAFVILAPIFGLKLVRQGMHSALQPHWNIVLWGCAAVFVVQLLHPWLARLFARVRLPSVPALDEEHHLWAWAAVVLLAVVWPFFGGRSAVDIATLALIYVMLGLGLNIVVGFAGLLDLGFVGFYAVGAYTYGLLYYWAGWSFWECLPLAGAMAALFGFLLGFPVLRLRGDYLAIVTLGFGEIIRLLLTNLTDWTGGPDGISGIPSPTLFGLEMTRRASSPEGQTFHEFFDMPFNPDHMVIYLYLLALALEELKQQVSPEIYETFALCRQGRSDKDVAALLGVKPNTVTVRKRRCMEILNAVISRLNAADPGLDLPPL